MAAGVETTRDQRHSRLREARRRTNKHCNAAERRLAAEMTTFWLAEGTVPSSRSVTLLVQIQSPQFAFAASNR
jgi:hypothetical protein